MSANLQAGRIRNLSKHEVSAGSVQAFSFLCDQLFQFWYRLVAQICRFQCFHQFYNSLPSDLKVRQCLGTLP